MLLKQSSVKWWPFCTGEYELMSWLSLIHCQSAEAFQILQCLHRAMFGEPLASFFVIHFRNIVLNDSWYTNFVWYQGISWQFVLLKYFSLWIFALIYTFLTDCGLALPYGIKDFDQHWFGWWYSPVPYHIHYSIVWKISGIFAQNLMQTVWHKVKNSWHTRLSGIFHKHCPYNYQWESKNLENVFFYYYYYYYWNMPRSSVPVCMSAVLCDWSDWSGITNITLLLPGVKIGTRSSAGNLGSQRLGLILYACKLVHVNWMEFLHVGKIV